MNCSYFNSNLLQETLSQKDTIASLNIELDQKNDRIRTLELSNRQKDVVVLRLFYVQIEISNLRRSQTTNSYRTTSGSSFELTTLRARVQSLESQLQEKDRQIATLEKQKPVSSPLYSTSSSYVPLHFLLDV